jgi:hypothetical protein
LYQAVVFFFFPLTLTLNPELLFPGHRRSLSYTIMPETVRASMHSPLESMSATDSQTAERTPSSSNALSGDACDVSAEESVAARIERLGRERPSVFTNFWSEVAFVFSISMSQLLTDFFVSGFTVMLPTLIRELDIPQAASVWPATAFSLVIASTLLVFGRPGDMYGGYLIFLGGIAWLLLLSVIAGFSVNPVMLNICRALQGFGPAASLPTGVMLMGSLYRPGPRKNLVFATYGTSAVFGFFGGIIIAGVVGQYLHWGFFFWIGAILAAVTFETVRKYERKNHFDLLHS